MTPRRLPVTVTLAFVASATITVVWCNSMSGMPGMEMPGGWTMSMAWMRMPGQGWLHAAATFIGMWSVMMVAMMLPALAPVLKGRRLQVAAAYFGTWTSFGALLFPFGVALAELAMRSAAVSRMVPVVAALVVVAAGILQASRWKARQLACCRHDASRCCDGTWRAGLQLGLRCISCCAPLTALLLVAGVMDLAAMAAVTIAITLERVPAAGERIARAGGAIIAIVGVCLLLRAA